MVVVDNDVVLKVACYSLHDEFVATATVDNTPPCILGVGRYVVGGRIQRTKKLNDRDRAKVSFDAILAQMLVLEPDDAELALAADFEARARELGFELDPGESQLLAITIQRACCLLLTGDKRAIRAIAAVCPHEVAKRVACLEQLVAHIVQIAGVGAVQPQVCSEPLGDQAMSICFGCGSGGSDEENIFAGLKSYIQDLHADASAVLLPGYNLAALAA